VLLVQAYMLCIALCFHVQVAFGWLTGWPHLKLFVCLFDCMDELFLNLVVPHHVLQDVWLSLRVVLRKSGSRTHIITVCLSGPPGWIYADDVAVCWKVGSQPSNHQPILVPILSNIRS
jgi:hypothetical protein